ncbi:MAG: hypothetical protein H7Y59_13325 [Anaerolineales bacterium]|nr:hypothetical protein [Anaerolineales bacterium]
MKTITSLIKIFTQKLEIEERVKIQKWIGIFLIVSVLLFFIIAGLTTDPSGDILFYLSILVALVGVFDGLVTILRKEFYLTFPFTSINGRLAIFLGLAQAVICLLLVIIFIIFVV